MKRIYIAIMIFMLLFFVASGCNCGCGDESADYI
jgi:predicted small secreted protein